MCILRCIISECSFCKNIEPVIPCFFVEQNVLNWRPVFFHLQFICKIHINTLFAFFHKLKIRIFSVRFHLGIVFIFCLISLHQSKQILTIQLIASFRKMLTFVLFYKISYEFSVFCKFSVSVKIFYFIKNHASVSCFGLSLPRSFFTTGPSTGDRREIAASARKTAQIG